MQKGGHENFGPFGGGGGMKKNHVNFTCKNRVYMIFCGVEPYFLHQKGGLQKFSSPKGGGEA